MTELLHRIKIFVFRMDRPDPSYLLLKPDQGLEALWGPLQGSLGFGDQLEPAIRRMVREDTGILPAGQVIDLAMPSRWQVGDEEIIEWAFGYRGISAPDPRRIEEHWAAHRWADFASAYPSLELDDDRAAIVRLHTLLGAA